jgi:predicted DNA-binding transcriptional regulator YafY
MDRLERLVNLVVALLDTPRLLTKDELRERVGGYSDDEDNFRRNFERDKDLLRQMGMPLLSAPLDPAAPEAGTGYRIPRDLYGLPDPGLDDDELMALGLATSTVALEGAGAGTATTALWKLAGASGARDEGSGPASAAVRRAPGRGLGRAGETGGPQGAPMADVVIDESVAALFSGVAERRVAHFTYNGTARRVDPYRLSYRQGHWYLAAFDHSRQAERLFRADRITGPVELEAVAAAFARPEGTPPGPPPPWRLGDDEEVVVELRVGPSQAQWVRALAGEVAVAGTAPDGSTYFKLSVTNREAFRGFVLGLLEHAEVIGPPEVRDEVVAWLEAIAGVAQK